MRLAISQPTFIPWAGYFSLIDYVDEFIYFDNVQFVKRSWMQRNKIKINDKEFFLTVSVNSKNKYLQKINEVKIDYINFDVDKILKTIQMNYSKSKYFEQYYDLILSIFKKRKIYLVDLNIDLIDEICKILSIKTKKTSISKLLDDLSEKNINLLKTICEYRNCNEYVSTIGAKDYMGDIDKFSNTNIKIKFFKYANKEYKQLGKKFIPYLSILDLLFNEGPNTINILRKNFEIVE